VAIFLLSVAVVGKGTADGNKEDCRVVGFASSSQ